MDYTKIPHFALFRQVGTVIVRVKMDARANCCNPGACLRSDHPWILHGPHSCDRCDRTRSNSEYSDCDCDFVDRSRPYRSSSAKSRYVNVCAAVCLVLIVGGLSPQSTAAPHRRTMDRQRRSSSQENSFWGNPCDYGSNPATSQYTAKLAKEVSVQARNAFESTAKHKEKFAKLHSFTNFDDVLPIWNNTDWLRNFKWFPEEGLPKDKVLYQTMPEAYMDSVMSKIDELLPGMYKGLKMVVAGLYTISEDGLSRDILSDASLKGNVKTSMHQVRAVLCLFDEIMRSRNLTILPLPNSEVPSISPDDKLSFALLVYRDTLNYLEYLTQVFHKMSEMLKN